jgi:hypoxanthine phosphoribosyltransferase
MHKDIAEILVSEQEIEQICTDLGAILTKDYEGKSPLLVGLLNGCVPFMAQLIKHVEIPLEIQFMAVSSYHGGIASTGDVQIKYDLARSVAGRDVLIVEDIVDTGSTLKVITELLKYRGAKSVKVVTLLDKPAGRKVEFVPDYIGKTIPKKFVVGYGLDYQEFYRNLPYVGVLKPEVYEK